MEDLKTLNLDTIRILNFLIHQNTEIDLKNLTIIGGNNGTGKSSILDALNFVITGGTVKTRNRDIRINDIIQKGSASCEVRVTGTLGNDPINLTRTRGKTTQSKMKITRSTGEEVQITEPDVRLRDLVSPIEFDRVIQINGHTISTLLSGTPSDVSGMFDSLFGVDIIREIRSRIKMGTINENINKINFEIEKMENAISVASQVGNATLQRNRLTQEKTQLEADNDLLSDELSSKHNEFNQMKAKEGEYKRFTMKQQQLKSERDALENLIRENQEKLVKLQEEKTQLSSSLTQLLGEFPSVDAMQDRIDQLGNEITDKIKGIAQQEAVPTVIDLIGNMIENDSNGSCPCCGKDFGDLTLDDLNGLKNRSTTTKNAVELEIDQKKEEKTHIQRSRGRVIEVQTTLNRVKTHIQMIEQEINDHQNKLTASESALSVLTSSDIGEFDPDRLREIDLRISTITGQRSEINKRIRLIDSEISGLPASSEQINIPSTTEVQQMKEKRQKLEHFKESLLDIQNGLARTMKAMRGIFVEKLNDRLNRYLGILSPNGYIRNVQIFLTQKKIKNKEYYQYSMEVDTFNGNKLLESLSTGQITLVMLAMIFALNEIQQPGIAFIMFDEPDETIDHQVREKLAEILVTMSQRKKIILTTRNTDFREKIAEIARDRGIVDECAFYECTLVNQRNRKITQVSPVTS